MFLQFWMTAPLSEVTSVVSVSNDDEDKAQTLSIPLRQGNTQELPWHHCHYSEDSERKREGAVLIQHLAVAVFNSIDRKKKEKSPPASECLSVPVTAFDDHFLCLLLLYTQRKRENAGSLSDASTVSNPVGPGWNTHCIPRTLCPIWVMNFILLQSTFQNECQCIFCCCYIVLKDFNGAFTYWNTHFDLLVLAFIQ